MWWPHRRASMTWSSRHESRRVRIRPLRLVHPVSGHDGRFGGCGHPDRANDRTAWPPEGVLVSTPSVRVLLTQTPGHYRSSYAASPVWSRVQPCEADPVLPEGHGWHRHGAGSGRQFAVDLVGSPSASTMCCATDPSTLN